MAVKALKNKVPDKMLWFAAALHLYANEQAIGKGVSQLTVWADKSRNGKLNDEDQKTLKLAVLTYIRDQLTSAAQDLQYAFFVFLSASELVFDSAEIRDELYSLIQKSKNKNLDRLTIDATICLLKTNKAPSRVLRQEILPIVLEQFDAAPNWRLLGILAVCVGQMENSQYTTSNLIDSMAKLYDLQGGDFDKAVRLRNHLWTSLTPPTDAVDIITKLRNRVSRLAVDIPYRMEQQMSSSRQSIYYYPN